jgi:DNA-binding NtrC family response regulator
MTRVLFVDDDPDILMAFKHSLRKEGYEILTAESAARALAILEHTPVDVIVSDQHMAGMTGEELLEIARVKCPKTVRIMLTGGADLNFHMRLIGEGTLYRFLCKPVATQDLARTVRNAIQCGHVAQESHRLRGRDMSPESLVNGAPEGRQPEQAQPRRGT